MVVIAFPGNETGKTFTTTVNKIELEVVGEGAMTVGALGIA